MTAPSPTARAARLNPFIFPADTWFRFGLLIAAVLAACIFCYFYLYTAVFGPQYIRGLIRCQDSALELYPRDLAAQIVLHETCAEELEHAQAAWIIGGTLLLFVVGGIIYWHTPLLKIRRAKLRPLTDEDAPDVIVYLAELCREVGLARPPIFLWNPLDPIKSGVAFGRLDRYYVALSGGLVTQFYTDLPAFRVVVLHELAHLRNADINTTYFTVAIWQAFILVALTPFAIGLAVTLIRSIDDIGLVLSLTWRGFVLAALVYLARSAILRTRELYADVRASQWDSPGSARERVVAQLRGARGGRWSAILAMHPDPADRLLAIGETHTLLRMTGWEAFGTGFTTMITYANLVMLFELLLPSQQEGMATQAAALLCAPMIAGILTIGGWRNIFVGWARGERATGIGQLTLALTLGLLAGYVAAFYTAIESISARPGSRLGWDDLATFYLPWSILLLASLLCFQRWIGETAAVWLDNIVTPGGLRRALVLSMVVTAALLSAWLGLLLRVQLVGAVSVHALWIAPLSALDSPPILLGFMCMWAIPLWAGFRSAKPDTVPIPAWMLLDTMPAMPAPGNWMPLRPERAMRIGALAGLMFSVLILFVRIGLRLIVAEEVRDTERFITLFVYGQIELAALLQAGAAAVTAAHTRRAGITLGLFSAFVGSCVMVVGILASSLLFGGTITRPAVGMMFTQIATAGALLSLPMAAGVAVAAEWWRRLHDEHVPQLLDS